VASLSQGRTAAAQCGLFTYKSVPVIFEPPCTSVQNFVAIYSVASGTHCIFPTCHTVLCPCQLQKLNTVNDCIDSHTFHHVPRYNTIYCVISFQVSILRRRGVVLELEALDFNSEARRNLICVQHLFHFFHKSHYIVVLLRGNTVFHYSM